MISDPSPTGDIYKKVTEDILRPMDKPSLAWYIGVLISLMCLGIGAISWGFRLGLEKGLAIAAARMVVQLALIGVVLKFIFVQTSPASHWTS